MTSSAPVHNPDIQLEIGYRIRSARQYRGLTLTQLSEVIEKSYQTVQKYEDGTIHISAVNLKQLADVLGASVGYFFGEVEIENLSSKQCGLRVVANDILKRANKSQNHSQNYDELTRGELLADLYTLFQICPEVPPNDLWYPHYARIWRRIQELQ